MRRNKDDGCPNNWLSEQITRKGSWRDDIGGGMVKHSKGKEGSEKKKERRKESTRKRRLEERRRRKQHFVSTSAFSSFTV